MNQNIVTAKKLVHWLISIVTVVYLLTGLGIAQYRIMESLTFGLLSKHLSFNIHDNLVMPFTILLILHITISTFSQRTKQK